MKTISELIKDLKKIRDEHGNLACFHDRFSGGLRDASIELSFEKRLGSKREVGKFWSEYVDKEETKGVKIVKVW